MVTLLVLVVFAAIFALVVRVILAGQRISAPRSPVETTAAAATEGESARWDEAAPD